MSFTIQESVPLAPYTTLGIGGPAEFFTSVNSVRELTDALAWASAHNVSVMLLGGGSNLLVSDAGISGLTIRIAVDGITYEEQGEVILVHAGAGVVFDTLVSEVVEKGYWGLENLSAIPGTVGGVPIQNVGAYGVEAKEVVESVRVFDSETRDFKDLTNEECMFAYRDSYFKHEGKDRYIVTEVTFKLHTTADPKLGYADLRTRFEGNDAPTLTDIRNAVIEIRSKKFPDWHVMGTAGSFFKNPMVSGDKFNELKSRYSELPGYEQSDGRYKIALGWILDKVLALKGFREGNVGLYSEQALVLVNHGGATFDEIRSFSDAVIEKIFDATGVRVEREVVVIE